MKPHCPRHEHVSRRALLKGSLLAGGGAVLANWGGLTGSSAIADQVRRNGKRCIMLWMHGGCSQFETFDPKVGRETSGVFRPISTSVQGVQICELMPQMAKHVDKLAIIRSMHTSVPDHPGGTYLMHTGYAKEANMTHPEAGAIVARYLGQTDTDLPNYIQIGPAGAGAGGGYLGPQYAPFKLRDDGRLPGFTSEYVAGPAESRRSKLRLFMDESFRRDRHAEALRAHQDAFVRTRRLMRAKGIFDADAEWQKYRDLYGDSDFGRNCMLARRLIESGVPSVEVGHLEYDSHADNATWHKAAVPEMEHGWAGLMTDLDERGLLDDTVVVWMGEVGRTPRINNRAGRDHYIRAWSTVLAGGGIKRNVVYGKTDVDGIEVIENPVTEGDFFATIYAALGIDHEQENFVGVRPMPLAPPNSSVISDLLA
jgi:hypothetical protein